MIRGAAAVDAPGMARVFVAAWRGDYRGVVPDVVIDGLDATELTARFSAMLLDRASRTVIWDDGDNGSGVLAFSRYGIDRAYAAAPDIGRAPTGYLASLYVDPGASGRGIGSALLAYALNDMAAECADVSLWVFTANHRARQLYERWGFLPTEETAIDPRWQAEQIRYRRPAG